MGVFLEPTMGCRLIETTTTDESQPVGRALLNGEGKDEEGTVQARPAFPRPYQPYRYEESG